MLRKTSRWILKILIDESGMGVPLVAGGIMLGSTLLGGLLGKNKQKTIDPYAALRGQYQTYLQGKLGTTTPYSYNEDFTTTQPDIEAAAEKGIKEGLGTGASERKADYTKIYNDYYNTQKAQMETRHADELEAQKNMYNRLGLVSSTPGLYAQTKLGRDQGQEYSSLEASIAKEAIGNELESERLAEDVYGNYLTQAQTLGNLQRGYQQSAMQMSEADIERMINEEQGYASLAGGLLGSNPPQTYYEPNAWSQIATAGQNFGTNMLLGNMLGSTGTATASSSGGTSPYIQALLKKLSAGG